MTFKLCVGFVCVCVCAPTGEPGFLRGAELQREMERLCYRERCTFCIQGTVTMVTYSHRGEVTLVCLFVCLQSNTLQSRLIGQNLDVDPVHSV